MTRGILGLCHGQRFLIEQGEALSFPVEAHDNTPGPGSAGMANDILELLSLFNLLTSCSIHVSADVMTILKIQGRNASSVSFNEHYEQ